MQRRYASLAVARSCFGIEGYLQRVIYMLCGTGFSQRAADHCQWARIIRSALRGVALSSSSRGDLRSREKARFFPLKPYDEQQNIEQLRCQPLPRICVTSKPAFPTVRDQS